MKRLISIVVISLLMFGAFAMAQPRKAPSFAIEMGLGYYGMADAGAFEQVYGSSLGLTINGGAIIKLFSSGDRDQNGFYVTAHWTKFKAEGNAVDNDGYSYDSIKLEWNQLISDYGVRYAWYNKQNGGFGWFGGGIEMVSITETATGYDLSGEYDGSGWFANMGFTKFVSRTIYSGITLKYSSCPITTEGGTSEGSYDAGGWEIAAEMGFAF